MNNILSTGFARYNSGGIQVYINLEDYESTIIGKYAGESLLGTKRFRNVFIGYKTGQFSVDPIENILIGWEAGKNIRTGSNNIILGRNTDFGTINNVNNVIAVGFENLINNAIDNTIMIGRSNSNYGPNTITLGNTNISQGSNNLISGFNNINYGNDVIVLGNVNNIIQPINNSLIIGNNNRIDIVTSNSNSNIIILGNDNIISDSNLLNAKPILIGYDLISDSNFVMNYGNTIIKYDDYNSNEILLLGIYNKYADASQDSRASLPTAIGYNQSNISDLNNIINFYSYSNLYPYLFSSNFSLNYNSNMAISITDSYSNFQIPSLYVKNGIYTDKITYGTDNINNGTITFIYNSNLANIANSNIIYTLPLLPEDTCNIYLTTTDKGELYWNKISEGDINYNGGSGGGGSVSSLNNTDKLKEGTSNFYYTVPRFDSRFDYKFNTRMQTDFPTNFNNMLTTKTLDDITNGTSNKYIKNGVYNQDLLIYGTLTVNKLQVLGIDLKNNNTINNFVGNTVANTSNELIGIINELRTRIAYLETKII